MSKDTIKQIGNGLAGICAILFIASSVIALLLFNIERKAFSSETYKRAFEDQKLYERMPGVLAISLSTSLAETGNANPLLNLLSAEDWERSITTLLPPDELKAITDQVLDSTFDYLNGKTDSAVISLLPIKGRLNSEAGVQAVTGLLQAQPDCTTEQLLQIGISALTGGDIVLCNPPAEVMGLMTPLIGSQLQFMTAMFIFRRLKFAVLKLKHSFLFSIMDGVYHLFSLTITTPL